MYSRQLGERIAALSPGSPAYASPEQIRQERLDASADLFSLGVVLYECLAGELPFPKSSSVAELVDLQLNTPYPNLAEVRSDVPAVVSAAIAIIAPDSDRIASPGCSNARATENDGL